MDRCSHDHGATRGAEHVGLAYSLWAAWVPAGPAHQALGPEGTVQAHLDTVRGPPTTLGV